MRRHPVAVALLREIDDFLRATGMTPTDFGIAVMRDGNFLPRLRGGRVPTLPTLDKVRRFIKRYYENVAQPPQRHRLDPGADREAD